MELSAEGQLLFVLATVLCTVSTVRSSSEETTVFESMPCKMKEVQFLLGTAIEFAGKAMDSLKESDMKFEDCPTKPEDCSVLYNCGKKSSGIYTLWPRSRVIETGFQAYCDMETDGGGWTVVQRRGNFGRAQDYFFQDWNAYKEGFGDPSEDFWIGNDILFAISNQKKYSIRFDLKDHEDNARWAKYDHFWIDSEESNYTLHVGGYKGDSGDSFSYHSGQKFTTKDRHNDENSSNCALIYFGAWWYKSCHYSNLNGLYLNGNYEGNVAKGVNWYHWRHYNYSFPFTEMKIKPHFSTSENSREHITIPS